MKGTKKLSRMIVALAISASLALGACTTDDDPGSTTPSDDSTTTTLVGLTTTLGS